MQYGGQVWTNRSSPWNVWFWWYGSGRTTQRVVQYEIVQCNRKPGQDDPDIDRGDAGTAPLWVVERPLDDGPLHSRMARWRSAGALHPIAAALTRPANPADRGQSGADTSQPAPSATTWAAQLPDRQSHAKITTGPPATQPLDWQRRPQCPQRCRRRYSPAMGPGQRWQKAVHSCYAALHRPDRGVARLARY